MLLKSFSIFNSGRGGAMVLGTLPVPGRFTIWLQQGKGLLRSQWVRVGVVWTFLLSSILSLLFLPLRETVRYRLKYCLKGPLNPKQPTNQFNSGGHFIQWSGTTLAILIVVHPRKFL